MTDSKIADKIEKLLALANNNPNENEAKLALLKAQKLMAEYNIELSSLSRGAELNHTLEVTKVKANPRNNQLGTLIANSFGVKGILVMNYWEFFGREADAKAAASALTYIHKVLEAGIRRVCKEHGLKSTQRGAVEYYNPYALGFINGLRKALGEQTKALCIVVPEDVNTKFAERFKQIRNYRGQRMRLENMDYDSYLKGHKDGYSAMDKRSLEA